jgi:soluble lytic murein transglycosylase
VADGATSSSNYAGFLGWGGQIGGSIVHSASRSGVASPPGASPGWWSAPVLIALLVAAPASASEPLCNSLSGLGIAAEALRRGDTAISIPSARTAWAALPRGPIGAHLAATLGLALLQAHRPAEAIEPLQAALASPHPRLEGELRLALGRAFLESGRPSEALVPLARASAPGPALAPRSARWLLAEAQLASGQVSPAIQRFEALLISDGADPSARRGRLLLAGAKRLAGSNAEALAAYRVLAIEEAEWPEGAEAAAALQRWTAAGGAGAQLSGDDRLRRAERLLQRGRPAEALAEVELAAGTVPPAPAAQAALIQALALAALDRFEEAVELARPLAASTDPGVRRGTQWLLARDASRAGRTGEATTRYRSVAESQGGIPGLGDRRSREVTDESAYLAAWLWYDAGDFKKATALLDAFLRARPTSPRADDARWFAAWSSFRAGDRRGAQARLARLETGPLADAALYWDGRLGGSSARARERLRQAALAGGDGWYGWLARRRLERLGATPPPWPSIELQASDPIDGASLERLGAAAAMFGLGGRDAAVQALEALANRGAARTTALEVCRLATFANEPALAFRVARDLLGQTTGTERWLYPAAFEGIVTVAARDAGIDEALLFAVVRRESGFRQESRSRAGAVGLGQLLPRTAERLGLLAELSANPAPLLADPATNLPLAALYLGLLRDRFGSDASALAAYNAGPAPPAGWSTPRPGQPLDEWVENIPYKETRLYVKVVLSSREAYRRLAGLPAQLDPAAPVPAPAEGVAF